MSVQKTCLVIGAGAGIGGTVGKRFAEGGYHAALCRRSDVDGLNGMVEDFKASGLSASGHLLNAEREDIDRQRIADEAFNGLKLADKLDRGIDADNTLRAGTEHSPAVVSITTANV